MKSKSIPTITFALLLLAILLATNVISQPIVASEIKTTVDAAVCAILRIFQALAAGVAALMIIMQGIKWMTSEDPATRKAAKDTITHVFVAMIIIIIAVQFVNYLVTGTGIAEFTSCPGITGPIVPPKGPNELCSKSSECQSGLYCAAGPPSKCQDKGGDTAPCSGANAPVSPEPANNACKSGYGCNPTSGKCEKLMEKPVAIITESSHLPVLECMKVKLHGDKSYDNQDGGPPCPISLCTYEWYDVDCNTAGGIECEKVKGNIIEDTKINLEYSYKTVAVGGAQHCIRLKVTDSDTLCGITDSTTMVKFNVYKNSPPQGSDSTKPNYVTIKNSNTYNFIALNEEFTLTAEVKPDNGGVQDTAEYSWGTIKAGDCTLLHTPISSSDSKAEVKVKITGDDDNNDKCEIDLKVKDSCGNEAIIKYDKIQIVDNQAPTAIISFSPYPSYIVQDQTVTMDGSGSKTGGNCVLPGVVENPVGGDSIKKYKWSWERTDPSSPAFSKSYGESTSPTQTENFEGKTGEYRVKLEVTDSHGATCQLSDEPFMVCEKLSETNNKPIANVSAITQKSVKMNTNFELKGGNSYDPDDWTDGTHNPGVSRCPDPNAGGTSGQKVKRYEWRDAKQGDVKRGGDCLCPNPTAPANCYVEWPATGCTVKFSQTGKHTVTLKVYDDSTMPVQSENTAEIEIDVTQF